MDLNQLVGDLNGIVSLALFVAAAVAALNWGRVKNLRDTADDLRKRVDDLEKERAEDRAEKAELTAENSLLKAMVTGKVEWVALTDQLEEHHRQALGFWEEALQLLRAMHAATTSGEQDERDGA